jgi:CBS domain-containing protein
MTRDPVVVGEDDDLQTVVELMERRRVKRLPVLRNGKVVGIVSRANLMRALVSLARSEEAPSGGDAALRERIVTAFAAQPWAPRVNIVVKDAIAELWGTITDERERQACIVTAENVAGVRVVHDHLTWVEPISGMAFPLPEDEAERESKYESKCEGTSGTKSHAATAQNAIH